jgi:hypothetical protein
MLKLQCKTTFNSVFVGKKIIKIEQDDIIIVQRSFVHPFTIFSLQKRFKKEERPIVTKQK